MRLRHVVNQLCTQGNLYGVDGCEQYLSQGIVEFIPLNHIFKTTSIRKDMINGGRSACPTNRLSDGSN